MVKLILLTVLYALFSTSGQRIELESDQIWKSQRYILVQDFTHRLPFPSPLCVVAYPFLFCVKGALLVRNIWYFMRSTVELVNEWCERLEKARSLSQQLTIIRSFFLFRPGVSDWDRQKYISKLTDADYSYWKFLAQQHAEQVQMSTSEEQLSKKIWEDLQYNLEQIEGQKNLIRKLDLRMQEIEMAVSSRPGYSRRRVINPFKSEPSHASGRGGSSASEFRTRHS